MNTFMGLPLASSFAERLGVAEKKKSQQQMSHPVREEAPILRNARALAEELDPRTLTQWPSLKDMPQDVDEEVFKGEVEGLGMDFLTTSIPMGGMVGAISPLLKQHPIGYLKKFVYDKYGQEEGSDKLLAMFKGTFERDRLLEARKEATRPNSNENLVMLSPRRFHALARDRHVKDYSSPFSEARRERITEGLSGEAGLSEMMELRVKYDASTNKLRVVGHNGRHRADVLQKDGIEEVPVRLILENERWKNIKPTGILSEEGSRYLDWEVKMPRLMYEPRQQLKLPEKAVKGGLSEASSSVNDDTRERFAALEAQFKEGARFTKEEIDHALNAGWDRLSGWPGIPDSGETIQEKALRFLPEKLYDGMAKPVPHFEDLRPLLDTDVDNKPLWLKQQWEKEKKEYQKRLQELLPEGRWDRLKDEQKPRGLFKRRQKEQPKERKRTS